MASSSISQLSASVTRILSLTGFPKELKTRDIQSAFSEYENASGGFKIKWIDDTSLLVVFADAAVGQSRFFDRFTFTTTQTAYCVFIRPSTGLPVQLSAHISQHSPIHLLSSQTRSLSPLFVPTTDQMRRRLFKM